MGCWRPQRQRRGDQRSSQMGRPPSALTAPHSPRPAAPSPGRGGRRLRIRSLAPAPLLLGPLSPWARPGRPPEGEGEGTSALFVTTESIVCEEPAPAGDGAERGAGGPDGGGARRGERGSEGGREAGAGPPRSLARAGRGRGGSEGGREGGQPGPGGPRAERTNGGSPRRKVQSSAAPREQPPPPAPTRCRTMRSRGGAAGPAPHALSRAPRAGGDAPARPPASSRRLRFPAPSPTPPRPDRASPGDGGGEGMDRSGRPRPREGGARGPGGGGGAPPTRGRLLLRQAAARAAPPRASLGWGRGDSARAGPLPWR